MWLSFYNDTQFHPGIKPLALPRDGGVVGLRRMAWRMLGGCCVNEAKPLISMNIDGWHPPCSVVCRVPRERYRSVRAVSQAASSLHLKTFTLLYSRVRLVGQVLP